MSDVFLPCEKQCGDLIAVDADMYRNSILLGEPVHPQHDVCPGAPTPEPEPVKAPRRFRVQIMVYEFPPLDDGRYQPVDEGGSGWDPNIDPEFKCMLDGETFDPIAGAGTTIEGESAGAVISGAATAWLGQTWHRVQDAAGFADVPAATPTTEPTPVP